MTNKPNSLLTSTICHLRTKFRAFL